MRATTFTLLAALALAGAAPAARGDGPLFVLLRPEAEVGDRVVRVAHVADVSGGTAAQRQAVLALDLADWKGADERRTVTRDEVKFRVLLEGHDRRSIVVGGASRCAVARGREAVGVEAVEQAARAAVAARVPDFAKPADVTVIDAPALPALSLGPKDEVRLEARLAMGRLPLGRTRAEVCVHVNGARRAVVPGAAAPSAAAAPTKGAPAPGGATPEAAAVKARERVKMVAPLGGAYAVAAGETLQEGRAGQLIRVRNLDSNRTVLARVLGRGIVQVEY